MRYLRAALVGFLGSLLMFVVMYVGIHVTGVAPFNLPPSAALLERMGLNAPPLALVVHFGYGGFWAIVLVAAFQEGATIWTGLGLAGTLWLFMMVVLSPLIGWGVFGSAAGAIPSSEPLALSSTLKYVVMTGILHVVYGAVVGGLVPRWASR
jgi:hypothetical protein